MVIIYTSLCLTYEAVRIYFLYFKSVNCLKSIIPLESYLELKLFHWSVVTIGKYHYVVLETQEDACVNLLNGQGAV